LELCSAALHALCAPHTERQHQLSRTLANPARTALWLGLARDLHSAWCCQNPNHYAYIYIYMYVYVGTVYIRPF
jgi:hypothetical protein